MLVFWAEKLQIVFRDVAFLHFELFFASQFFKFAIDVQPSGPPHVLILIAIDVQPSGPPHVLILIGFVNKVMLL